MLPNADPRDMAPRMIDEATVINVKPTLDSCTRGETASGYLKELCQYYKDDKIAPGLQSAWLPDKEVFYVAVHRFPTASVNSRTVISKASDTNLEQAEKDCMAIWRGLVKQVEAARANAAQE